MNIVDILGKSKVVMGSDGNQVTRANYIYLEILSIDLFMMPQ